MTANKSLSDVLSEHKLHIDNELPAIAQAYENIIERLLAAGAGKTAPDVGDMLPPFLLPDDSGRLVSSADLLNSGPLVVSMNRGHWCSFCRLELDALQGIYGEVQSLGGSVMAIAPEYQRFARQLKAQCSLEFPVLCDVDNAYAISLGLAVWLGEEVKPLFAEIGIDLELYQGNPSWLVPIPATYVVAADGRIIDGFIAPDYRRRMEPNDILTALRSVGV